jgi:hypothetical protein
MRREPFSAWRLGAAALIWALSCQCCAAEVRLSGTADRMVLQANDASIGEVVDALRSAFDLPIEVSGDSPRRLTGRYSGSVRQVLLRLLQNEDYVTRFAPDRVSIRLVGVSAAAAHAAAASSPPAWQGSRLIALRQGKLKRTGESP